MVVAHTVCPEPNIKSSVDSSKSFSLKMSLFLTYTIISSLEFISGAQDLSSLQRFLLLFWIQFLRIFLLYYLIWFISMYCLILCVTVCKVRWFCSSGQCPSLEQKVIYAGDLFLAFPWFLHFRYQTKYKWHNLMLKCQYWEVYNNFICFQV